MENLIPPLGYRSRYPAQSHRRKLLLATYMCTFCKGVIPKRKHCSIAAIGYDPLFSGFACLSRQHFACRECILPLSPGTLNRSLMNAVTECGFCGAAKQKNKPRLRLHVPDNLANQLGGDEMVGCIVCVRRHVVGRLNDHFTSPQKRLGCPTCRRPKGIKTFMASEIISTGTQAYGDLQFTCRSCIKSNLGWGIPYDNAG